jgi:hypothetical protein
MQYNGHLNPLVTLGCIQPWRLEDVFYELGGRWAIFFNMLFQTGQATLLAAVFANQIDGVHAWRGKVHVVRQHTQHLLWPDCQVLEHAGGHLFGILCTQALDCIVLICLLLADGDADIGKGVDNMFVAKSISLGPRKKISQCFNFVPVRLDVVSCSVMKVVLCDNNRSVVKVYEKLSKFNLNLIKSAV